MRQATDWLRTATFLGFAAVGLACSSARAEDTSAPPPWPTPTPAQCKKPTEPPDVLLTLARCCVTDPQDVDGGKGCVGKPVGSPEYYSILRDSKPAKQGADLLIPTDAVTGVEDAAVLKDPWAGYFDQAWRFGEPKRGHKTALAVNSKPARDNNQLHVHVGCVNAKILPVLAKAKIHSTPVSVTIDKHPYKAVWVKDLTGDDSPFRVVDKWVRAGEMQYQGIAVVGAVKEDSSHNVVDDNGYFILDTAGKTKEEGGLAESVIDYSICK